jgi:curved DNA-binding protein CbpA
MRFSPSRLVGSCRSLSSGWQGLSSSRQNQLLQKLGMPPGQATRESLKVAFRNRAKSLHPDIVGGNRQSLERAAADFNDVKAAYDALLKNCLPAQIDAAGSSGQSAAAGQGSSEDVPLWSADWWFEHDDPQVRDIARCVNEMYADGETCVADYPFLATMLVRQEEAYQIEAVSSSSTPSSSGLGRQPRQSKRRQERP